MKKFILITLIIFATNISAFALTTKDTLSVIENNLFGYEYKTETDIARVERIEEHLYGQKKTGTVQKRIESIKSDTGIIVEEPKPVITAEEKARAKQEQRDKELKNLKEDSTVDYPIVDKMEQEIFHTTYKNENIYSRLDRLEERVFKQKSNADLNTRVDKLASFLKPSMPKNQTYQDNYTVQDMDDYYASRGFEPVNNQTLPLQLMALEKEILRRTYDTDNNAVRLTRLEQSLFNRTFPNDADTTRMQRIKVAYDAKQNSYKYENNRRMQNVATMSQVGSILLMILAILL